MKLSDAEKLAICKAIDDHHETGWWDYDEEGNLVGCEAGDAVIAVVEEIPDTIE